MYPYGSHALLPLGFMDAARRGTKVLLTFIFRDLKQSKGQEQGEPDYYRPLPMTLLQILVL